MSAIAHSETENSLNSNAPLIGLHADHRPQDPFFARVQSPGLRKLEWESRMRPLRSWGPGAVWALAILLFVAAYVSLLR
jgi:hypothetical protein